MSNQFGDTRIDDDLTLLSETLEEVLRSSGDPADQKYVELKARAEKALDDVKKRVSQASDSYYYRAKQAVYRADDYVHEKPWQGIGVGASRWAGSGTVAGTPLKPPYTGVLHFFCRTPYNVRLLTGRGPRAITYYGAGKSTAPFVARDSGDTRHSGYRYSFPSQRRF